MFDASAGSMMLRAVRFEERSVFRFADASGGERDHGGRCLFLRRFELTTVEFEKQEADEKPDASIPGDERVIFDETGRELGGKLADVRRAVMRMVARTMQRRLE